MDLDLELAAGIVEASIQPHGTVPPRAASEEIILSYAIDVSQAGVQFPANFLKTPNASFQPDVLTFKLANPSTFALETSTNSDVRSLMIAAFNILLYRYTQQETLDLELTCIDAQLGKESSPLMQTLLSRDVTARKHIDQVSAAVRPSWPKLRGEPLPLPNANPQMRTAITLSFVENASSQTIQASTFTALEPALSDPSDPFDGFDLHVIVLQQEIALQQERTTQVIFRYNANLFSSETMQRLAGHLQVLLEAMVRQPNSLIAQLPMLTQAEEHQLQVDWNNTAVDFPLTFIHQHVEAHAVQQPDAIAITFKHHALTYAELNQRANQLAHYLTQRGIGAADRVAVCVEPCLDILVAVLGIFKAGGTYVPLDPTHPAERLAAIVADTQPQLLLTQSHVLPHLPAISDVVFCLDDDWLQIQTLPTHNPETSCDLEQAAYVVYTSGTTGKPKGVVATHGNLVNYILAAQQEFRFDRQDVIPAIARFTFSITFFELLSPLVAGGTLVILEREHILDFNRMVQTLQQVTVAHMSPSLLRKLLAHIQDTEVDSQTFQRLRHISSGGDTVSADLLARMHQVFPQAEVYVLYGSSEVSCMGCFYPVPTARPITKSRVGKPFANVSVRLLDPDQNSVPIGVVGEVYFGGAGITRGYLNQDELTHEKFVAIAGQRFYRMGDLGRFDADGNLELLGRADFQIKLRGIRIEPGEIEAALRQVPGVREGIVVARNLGHSEDKSLVAYIVPDPAQRPSAEDMRRFLQIKLPDYMVPLHFVELAALPLNINQKVDRRALPDPTLVSPLSTRPYQAPKTPLEKFLADLWATVLGLEQVGTQDDFFSLGGHSLLAAQVLSRLQEALNREIPISRLFEFPTIATLAAHLATLPTEETAPATTIALAPIPRHPNLPLSQAQARFWYLAQLEAGTAYNIPLILHLTGVLDVAVLQRSLTALLHRHEVLRTVFPVVAGTPVQRILPPQAFSLPVIALPDRPEAEQQAEVSRLAQAALQQAFNLAEDLPVRGSLLCLAETKHVLLLTLHHIAADGWSLALFRQELTMLYSAFSQGQPSPLADLPLQYADFAHWQTPWLNSAPVQDQLVYWKQQLADAPPLLELPCDRPRPPQQTYRGGSEFFTLSAELTQQLKTLSQRAGATLFMTLLASFATVLSRHSQHTDLVIGSPIANRNRRELETLQGVLINLLALRIDLSGNPAFLDLLHRVRQTSLAAFAHADIPFDQVVEAVQPDRNPSYSPLFQVLFVLQNAPVTSLELPGLTLTPLTVESGTAKYDLTLMMEETATGLTGELEYNRDLFDRATIARMVGHLQTVLAGVVAQPNQTIATLPMLTAPERQQILVTWNHTEVNYPHNQGIHQLVEQQVERTPDAIAVVFEQQQLTYRQLNNRANQLARLLQRLGVGPEVLVGIYVERSLEMVVGVLGILKAGGAYVPLDPAYPQDRLAFMLADTQAPVLVTQRSLQAQLPDHSAQVVYVDDAHIYGAPTGDSLVEAVDPVIPNPSSGVNPHNLAYLIYTSGSTGQPKGVQIEHRSAVNLLNSVRQQPGLTAQDTLLSVTTLSFDIVVSELFLPLSVGARLVLVSRAVAADGRQLLQVLTESGATFMQPTPATWRLLLAAGWPGSPHLRMVSTGEPLPRDLANQLLPKGQALWNLYGPTETTIWSTGCQVQPGDGPIDIGRPLDNTQLYILDAHQQPVPIGVPGELYIGGDGLARGYLNRPELTAERFVPHPLSPLPGARLYRTGDLVRWLPDGQVECLGRIDHQVKIRGFRMELGEIESALSQHPQVQQCVVVAREDQPGEKRLVAYVIASTPIPGQDYRQYLHQTLPEYMIPAAFVPVDNWPLTPNGKIDRRALPLPTAADLAVLTSGVPARTPLEHQLVAIWEDLLNIQPIGIHDSFFDLGGHSLLTVQLSMQIEQLLGQKIPLSTILTAPTIAQLATILEPNRAPASQNSVVLLKPGQDKPPVFLIHDGDGEILLYRSLAHQLDPAIPVYGIQPYSCPGAPILHSRIDAAVTYYVQQIRQVQPQGPYCLGGMCVGGVLALAIAQHLQQQGETVKMLAMLDAVDVETPQHPGYIAKQRLNSFSTLLQGQSHRKRHEKLLYGFNQTWKKVTNLVLYELQKQFSHVRDQAQLTLFRYYLDRGLPLPQCLQGIPVRKVLMWAKQEYVPQGQFVGEILLLRATQKSRVFDDTDIDDTPGIAVYSDPLLGWGKRTTAGVQVHDVPGGHSSMLQEPHVLRLAEIMQAYLDTAPSAS
jgi:surfactin family lipopeptide synthetase A